ncbi:hypothetical protein EV363DRAFT_1418653 [Boletus edulis]|nr:hypothetical protein EV363DRAFT_1418653 [Boletus edulis]
MALDTAPTPWKIALRGQPAQQRQLLSVESRRPTTSCDSWILCELKVAVREWGQAESIGQSDDPGCPSGSGSRQTVSIEHECTGVQFREGARYSPLKSSLLGEQRWLTTAVYGDGRRMMLVGGVAHVNWFLSGTYAFTAGEYHELNKYPFPAPYARVLLRCYYPRSNEGKVLAEKTAGLNLVKEGSYHDFRIIAETRWYCVYAETSGGHLGEISDTWPLVKILREL